MQAGLLERFQQRAGFIKEAGQPSNKLDIGLVVQTAELINQYMAVAINQHCLRTKCLALPKRREQRPEFGYVVAALELHRLRQRVARAVGLDEDPTYADAAQVGHRAAIAVKTQAQALAETKVDTTAE